ncbi:S-adenosyl-L-methionine-dependent methyltransferase [Cladochytrium replicatum]|nr:S-adenosyl-L-methionine-dependent methyltransferase [Cladochytrium replicatum]
MGNLCSTTEDPNRNAALDASAAANWIATSADQDGGRTFHAEKKAPYVLPADLLEGSRLNLQHHLFREMFGGPNYSGVTEEQLKKGLRVLDIGCGTGIWLAEMHRDFPNGTYFGVDLITTQWAETFKDLSENKIALMQANVLERLPFEDDSFDYVHQRMLVSGIPVAKWPHVISEIARVLKPGGVADLTELGGEFLSHEPKNQRDRDMWKFILELFNARGIDLKIPENLGKMVRNEAQFEKVQELRKEAPIGWGGYVGELWKVDMRMVFMAVQPFVAAALGISAKDWEDRVDAYFEDAGASRMYTEFVSVEPAPRKSISE